MTNQTNETHFYVKSSAHHAVWCCNQAMLRRYHTEHGVRARYAQVNNVPMSTVFLSEFA